MPTDGGWSYVDRICPICGSTFIIRCDAEEYVYQVPAVQRPDGTWTRETKDRTKRSRVYLCRYACWRKAMAAYADHKAEKRKEAIGRITEARRKRK